MIRSGLAYQVARKLEHYLDSMAVSSRYVGTVRLVLLTVEPQQEPYIIGESTPKQWQIGEGFMHQDNMFLVRLVSVSNGSWQPEIWVADPAT